MTTVLDCPPIESDAPRSAPTPDLAAIKARQHAMWASGDFAIIGTTLQIAGESLCEAVDLSPAARVLDVACGNGNATLAAARRFCRVTGLDYVPELLERAEARARAERLDVTFQLGDAEDLPFEDGAFDVVLSTFGAMFAPNQQRTARELARVCAPSGTIGLANWTPEGFIGKLLRAVGRHVPPPPGLDSPILWGTEKRLRELFADSARSIRIDRKDFVFRYRSAEHFIDVFRRFYGPTHKAFESLSAARQAALAAGINVLLAEYNRRDGFLRVPGEYLEVVIERK